jgi:hypothetical protein
MRHASGIFYFPLCAITQIQYNFEGPWYNSNGNQLVNYGTGNVDEIIRLSLTDIARSIGGNPLSQIIQSVNNVTREGANSLGAIDKAYNTHLSRKMNQAFPMIANVSISVKNLLPTFRDDYLNLYFAAGQGPQSVVSVTQTQTGTIPENRINSQRGDFRLIDPGRRR